MRAGKIPAIICICTAMLCVVTTAASAADVTISIEPEATSVEVHNPAYIVVGWNYPYFSFACGQRFGSFGLEYGMLATWEYPYYDYNDYPCPHMDYTYLGEFRVEGCQGIDLLLFTDLGEYLAWHFGFGFYWQKYADLVSSDLTGYLYAQSTRYEFFFPVSIGCDLQFRQNVVLGMGYHTIRGFEVRVGINF